MPGVSSRYIVVIQYNTIQYNKLVQSQFKNVSKQSTEN